MDQPALAISLAETKTWAIRRELLAGLARVDGHLMLLSEGPAESSASTTRGVSVVPLKGVITPRPSILSMLFGGGGGLQGFLEDLQAAADDEDTRAIVLDIDSPGGVVDLVPEAAAVVRDVRDNGGKPIVAVANVQASSAAYWLASQANEVVVTPSGSLGSIGVYSVHRDMSEAFAQEGIKHTIVSAGKYKVEANPYEPLDEEAAAAEQAIVDDYYSMFVKDVAAGRQVSESEVTGGYGEGRNLTAQRAVEAGLADRVSTLGKTIARMSSTRARVMRSPAPATAVAAASGDLFVPLNGEHSHSLSPSPAPPEPVHSKEDRLRLLDALVVGR